MFLGLRDRLALRVLQVLRVRKGFLVQTAPPVRKGQTDHKAQPALRAQKVPRVQKDLRARKGFLVQTA